jgi:hypothetical protein
MQHSTREYEFALSLVQDEEQKRIRKFHFFIDSKRYMIPQSAVRACKSDLCAMLCNAERCWAAYLCEQLSCRLASSSATVCTTPQLPCLLSGNKGVME